MLATATLALAGCGIGSGGALVKAGAGDGGHTVIVAEVDAGIALDAGSDAGTGAAPVPDAGLPPSVVVDAGTPPTSAEPDAGSVTPPASSADAGSTPAEVADAGTPPSTSEPDAGAVTPPASSPDAGAVVQPTGSDAGSTSPGPSFGSWAWGAPDTTAVVHAGFQWFESGYPGTLAATDNAYLSQHGTLPFAYINMAEVPADTYLQGQIGSFWSSIALCTNTNWNSTVVDVRDPRWQDWLVRRANSAYALGNRGIKWDVADVEDLCNGWSGVGGTAPQQAIDAMASVLAQLKAQHPDFKFIVNKGFGLAEQHPDLVDGFEIEDMLHYANSHSGDAWANETIARIGAIHTNSHIPIFDLEYYDLFGCSDTTCAYASQLYSQLVALDWVPYITVVDMNVQGRGLNITPPW